jgi:hypothetical protein
VRPDPLQFGLVAGALVVVVVAVVATGSPDPSARLRGVVPGVVVALIVAYLVGVSGE